MRFVIVLILVFSGILTEADDVPTQSLVTLQRNDAALAADFHPADTPAPVLVLIHMLNSDRGAWTPLIPDLLDSDYAILNIDLRGHGQSTGERDWEAAIDDVAVGWVGWLGEAGHLNEAGVVFIGASIGANLAIISCAETEACRGAVALSPGLDYRGVKPESALVDGLAHRAALLVAAQDDSSSAAAVRQMFLKAEGQLTARMYRGRAHGTRLFDSDYESVSRLLLGWLAEHLPAPAVSDAPIAYADGTETICGIPGLERSKRDPDYIICSSVPANLKPIRSDHCLYEYLDDRDDDGIVCESKRSES